MDIDIDLPTSFSFDKLFPEWTKASIFDKEKQILKPHPCGVYPQRISRDPVTNLSAIPYDTAEDEFGFIKIDFLHLSIYDFFSSREEIKELLEIEPEWNLLKVPSVVAKLFQLSKHYETVSKIKPKTIEELADVLALIRPGKKDLIGLYLKDRESCRKILYSKTSDDEYSFKKSHSISYAMVIQLKIHLISAGIIV